MIDHSRAADGRFVEQYLLDELSPELRDEFEEHFFDCVECSSELRAASSFLRAAKEELAKPELLLHSSTPSSSSKNPLRTLHLWRPLWTLSALAACLLVIVYQNVFTMPRLRGEVAGLHLPSVLSSISLVGGNSRGGVIPSSTLGQEKSILLQVDIPAEDRFSSYTCSLYSPQHQLLWTVGVSADEAKNTVSIRAPLAGGAGGIYSLEVRGKSASQSGSSSSEIEVANYHFALSASNAGEGH
jgi:hypothetical protein